MPGPPCLGHDRLNIALQRIGDLRLEPPIALPVHLKSASKPVGHGSMAFRAAAKKMLDRIRSSLLASLEPRAGVIARRALGIGTARDEHIVVGEAEPRRATIGDGAELALVDQPRAPHLGSGLGRQIEVEVTVLVLGDLALGEVRRAFRSLAARFHPDRATALAERAARTQKLAELTAAYHVLRTERSLRRQLGAFAAWAVRGLPRLRWPLLALGVAAAVVLS